MDGLAVAFLFLVIFSFLLFLIRVGLIFYHNILLSRELKRTAREAATARRCDNPVVTTNDNQTNEAPKDDLPPAYDDIVQTKLALQAAAEEGRMSSNAAAGQSTVALTTFVDASGSNASIGIATSGSSAAQIDETLPPAYENAVFEYDDAMNGNRNENKSTTV